VKVWLIGLSRILEAVPLRLGSEAGNHSRPARLWSGILKTPLNVCPHAIPESQKRAVDKVAEILLPNVPEFSGSLEREDVN
jgi:hypothetical protein